jgi:glycine betaine/proline transport system substrate-binding protein
MTWNIWNPKGVYPKDACTIISRRGFEADQPEATFSKNFNLEEGQLADLMTIIKDKGEEERMV